MIRVDRTILFLVALSAGACGETAYGPPRYTLSGTVVDSVTGAPVVAALVSVDVESAVSDTLGAFALSVDSGSVDLAIAHEEYEEFASTFQLVESQLSDIDMRRLAPYVRDYFSLAPVSGNEPGLESALVSDLQGYANADTTQGQAELWFGDMLFTFQLSSESDNVEWVIADSLTIQVAVWLSPGLSRRDSVLWTVFDVDGHTAKWLCYPAGYEPECVERS
jgi:hypothetical protein